MARRLGPGQKIDVLIRHAITGRMQQFLHHAFALLFVRHGSCLTGWELEAGSWKLGAGNWKLGVGSWERKGASPPVKLLVGRIIGLVILPWGSIVQLLPSLPARQGLAQQAPGRWAHSSPRQCGGPAPRRRPAIPVQARPARLPPANRAPTQCRRSRTRSHFARAIGSHRLSRYPRAMPAARPARVSIGPLIPATEPPPYRDRVQHRHGGAGDSGQHKGRQVDGPPHTVAIVLDQPRNEKRAPEQLMHQEQGIQFPGRTSRW